MVSAPSKGKKNLLNGWNWEEGLKWTPTVILFFWELITQFWEKNSPTTKIPIGQETVLEQLAEVLEANKNKVDKDTFWFCDQYLVRLIKRFNFKSKKATSTLYSKKKLMESMAPALFFHYTMRRMFGISGKEGRVYNADESMNYRWDPSTKTWSH